MSAMLTILLRAEANRSVYLSAWRLGFCCDLLLAGVMILLSDIIDSVVPGIGSWFQVL